MTSKQCLKMIQSMKRDVCKSIDEEAKHLIQSGGIDLSEYPKDNYAPAKIIISISLTRIAHGYKPFAREYLADYKNLKHF